jgi:single-strand DNA-binding protein
VVLAGRASRRFRRPGFIGVTPLAGFPRSPILGLYPSVETLAAQLIMALLLGDRLFPLARDRCPRLPDWRPGFFTAACVPAMFPYWDRHRESRASRLYPPLNALWRLEISLLRLAGQWFLSMPMICSKEDDMAGVNKVILVGNLGDDRKRVRSTMAERSSIWRVATSEIVEGSRRQNRQERTEWHRVVIFNREPRQGCQAISAQGVRRSISRARSRPANGPTSRARTAIRPRSVLQRFRGELVLLDRRDGGGAADDYGDSFGGSSDFGGGRSRQPREAAAGFRHRAGRRRPPLINFTGSFGRRPGMDEGKLLTRTACQLVLA